jgi:hypothetical protein
MTIATFCYGPTNMQIAPGITTDSNGQAAVPTGASGGSNAGANVINALRAGLLPAAPKTAGYLAAAAAATTAIAAVSSTPTGAQVTAALTAVLNAATALTAA